MTVGTIIGVAANAGPRGPSLAPLPPAGDLNLSQFIINDMVMEIKRILLDESLPPDNMSARSATEIVERMKELAQNMGSAFGRLIDEVLIPIDEVTLAVLNERGVIDFPLKVDGREVKAVPTSPLAMAQNMDEVESIVNYAQLMSLMGGQGTVALDDEVIPDYVGDAMGVPAQVRRTQDARAAKLQELHEQQMIGMAAQTAMESASKGPPPPNATVTPMKVAA